MKKWWCLAAALALAAPAGAQGKLYMFNWAEYLPEELIKEFRDETGIDVVYSTYESNEALYAKLKLLDGGGYDLAVPSTYYVSKMRRENLLHPIDRQKLTNFSQLDPQRLDQPFDPGNEYSVPYLWGSTGLAVNRAAVDPATVQGWTDLWNPALKGRVMLLNEMRDVFHMALRTLGFSGNTTDPEQIRQAYERLVVLLPGVRLFNSDMTMQVYIGGEADAGMIWNGEAHQAAEADSNIVYIYPREGALLWMDNLVIPRTARNVDQAHKMIDFLLRPDVARRISEALGYASPNLGAIRLLDAATAGDRTVYPTPEDLQGAEYQLDVGEANAVYLSYWDKLKTGR